jgi:hypothetical protein
MTRERITITLKKELVQALDKTIDGAAVRNRSHAVEMVLSKALLKKPVKALILAGGKEIRLPQLGKEVPKTMLPVQGRPILEHILLRLKSAGIEEIILSIGQGGQKIRDYFRNGSRFGVNIGYLEQDQIKKRNRPTNQTGTRAVNGRPICFGLWRCFGRYRFCRFFKFS